LSPEFKLVCVYEDSVFSAQISYAFDLLLSTFDVDICILPVADLHIDRYDPEFTIVITYGSTLLDTGDVAQVHIYQSELFGRKYLSPAVLPALPLERYTDLPVIYKGCRPVAGHVRSIPRCLETDIDIVASAFFMVTRYEELLCPIRDSFGRFPVKESLAYKENFLDRPIVNEYIDLLESWIKEFIPDIKRKKPWGEESFTVCLTHDVDHIYRYNLYPPIGTIWRTLLQRDFHKAWAIGCDFIQVKSGIRQDPYTRALDYILELESGYGYKSSFYFLADNADYDLNDQCLRGSFAKISNAGFEIGLHASFTAYDSPGILKREKERLADSSKNIISGGRQHYLKWKNPDTWRAWEKAGLTYDATVGFPEKSGFRCGICHPFKPYDLQENRVMNIWELPLIINDVALAGYSGLSAEEGYAEMACLLNTVKKYNGVLVLLWHNRFMCDIFTPEWKRSFERIYNDISISGGRCITASELVMSMQ
jgi:hypothetical protein